MKGKGKDENVLDTDSKTNTKLSESLPNLMRMCLALKTFEVQCDSRKPLPQQQNDERPKP
jgi:hypothetical protein